MWLDTWPWVESAVLVERGWDDDWPELEPEDRGSLDSGLETGMADPVFFVKVYIAHGSSLELRRKGFLPDIERARAYPRAPYLGRDRNNVLRVMTPVHPLQPQLPTFSLTAPDRNPHTSFGQGKVEKPFRKNNCQAVTALQPHPTMERTEVVTTQTTGLVFEKFVRCCI